MKSSAFAAKGIKLTAFAIAMLMIASFGIEFLAIGLVLGIAYAAWSYLPATGLGTGQRRRSGVNTQLVMLGVGALAVCAVALMISAVPGPAPIAGADTDAARATATYKGVEYCKTCHGEGGFGGDEYTGWAETGHGRDFTKRPYHGTDINMFTQSGGSCQKCHVVAYNQTAIGGWDPAQAWNSTYNSGLGGIQCENCHGPGSLHNGGSTGIIAAPTVNQSCNGDGVSFCHGPGGHDGPMAGTTAWYNSLHAPTNEQNAATPFSYQNANCAKCHSPSQYDPSINSSNPNYNITKDNYVGVACYDCHDMHGDEFESQLKYTKEDTCVRCHTADKTAVAPGKSPGHRTQKEMFSGTMGANVTGTVGMPGVTCADCHMWYTPAPVRGVYLSQYTGYPKTSDHSMTPTAEACEACHSTLPLTMPNYAMPPNANGANATNWTNWDTWLTNYEREVGKWNTTIEDWQKETTPLLTAAIANVTAAKAAIDTARADETKDPATIASATALWGDAYWNEKLVENDKSNGVHNHDYALALLRDAITKSKQAIALMTTNTGPVANAGPNRVASTNQEITFDGSASTDLDGTIIGWLWDFGDGANSTEMTATHSYTQHGFYYVKLTVTDNKGTQASTYITVFINDVAPRANAGPDQTVNLGDSVLFSGASSDDPDGDIDNFTWEFGDGEMGYGEQVTHAYAKAGIYIVKLTVVDDDNGIAVDFLLVTVLGPGGSGGNKAPTAVAGNDLSTAPNTKVSFNGSASTDADGTIQNYTWSFGDGTFGYGAAVDHTYATPGVYAVILTVTDNQGAAGMDIVIVGVQTVTPPVDLTPLQNNLTSLKTDLGKATTTVDNVQKDTASMKKDVSDTKKSVDSLAGNLGMYMAVVLIIAIVAALVLYMMAGSKAALLQKQLDGMKEGKKEA